MRRMSVYEHDFYSWTQEQAEALRRAAASASTTCRSSTGQIWREEIWELGLSLELELYHRYVVLLQHLLKWRYQHRLSGPSWRGTIKEQRRRIARLLQEESRA